MIVASKFRRSFQTLHSSNERGGGVNSRIGCAVINAGLRFWSPWRTKKNKAPLQFLKFQKIDFYLKQFYNNITKAGAELQRLSKKYKNLH